MANIHKPDENIKTDVAAIQATRSNNANVPIYFSMKNYDLGWFLIFTGARTAAASLTCRIWESVGAAGVNQVLAVKAAATVVTGNAVDATLFVRGEDLTVNTGYTHVGIRMLETASQNFIVGALLLRLRARYKQAILLV